jgi:hypothetical protein
MYSTDTQVSRSMHGCLAASLKTGCSTAQQSASLA